MNLADDARATPAGNSPSSAAAEPFLRLKRALADRYALEFELAQGGMGTVLRARDLRHDRPVAVKILRPELSTAIAASRFLREVHTAAGLNHPNIVTVFDSGEADGLLYYVMPLVEGESLRERLTREGPLPIAQAVRIAGEVADALAFAHARGVIHRDIKPENILLAAHGHAQVTDFGVARAVSEAADPKLTGTGAFVGSPLYLSPEQAAGAAVDARADIYSLGCVLYEMLAGTPPFDGPSLTAILIRQLREEPTPLSRLRPDVPPGLEAVVARAMEKAPGDRFEDARALAEALAQATLPGSAAAAPSSSAQVTTPSAATVSRPSSRVRPAILALLVLAAGSGAAVLASGFLGAARRFLDPDVALDSTRYTVFPFVHGPGVPPTIAEADRVRDALARWGGIDVVDPGDAGTVLSPGDADGVAPARARVLARKLKAGRFVAGRITREGDSVRVYAELGDAAGAGPARARVRLAVPAAAPLTGTLFQAVADSLALAGLRPECVEGGAGTLALAAVRACDRAFAALDQGDLPGSDSLFQQALRADPRYARAALWLLQSRGWLTGRQPPRPELVAVVGARGNALPARERALAEALRLMSAGRFVDACRLYGTLTAADSLDVAAWMGLGECHRRDDLVVRDRRSPSGWSFRSSYNQAVRAYERAFEIRPQMMRAYNEHGFARVREALFTSTGTMRTGRAGSPDTLRFAARPELSADTLRFVPFGLATFARARAATRPAGLSLAVDRQRRLFRELAVKWAAGQPASAEAAEAVVVSLDLMGDPAAVTAIAAARRLARAPVSLRLAQDEVWLRVKFGIPDRLDHLLRARFLADSLLRDTPPAHANAEGLENLAILLGRADQAAALARLDAEGGGEALQLPVGLVSDGRALLAFASLGEPRDSLLSVAHRVMQGIQNAVAPQDQGRAREALLVYPAVLAFPSTPLPGTGDVVSAGGYLGTAILAWMRRDTAGTRSVLRNVQTARLGARPADISIDALFVEAWLLSQSADAPGAVSRLAATLDVARWLPPLVLDNPGRAGTLIRAIALRADLAAGQGESAVAARWAGAVLALWAGADPALSRTTARMRSYMTPVHR